jgi:transcriptional regulator with XRE-family HTH domain
LFFLVIFAYRFKRLKTLYFDKKKKSKNIFMNTIGERIIKARKDKNWSQTQLAERMGVNLKNITRWELNQSTPSITAAIEMAKALDVSLDFIGGLQKIKDIKPNTKLSKLLANKEKDLSRKQIEVIKTILEAF